MLALIDLFQVTCFNSSNRFFETEGIAILTMFISRYRITIKEEPQFVGETFEQRKTRVLKCTNVLTLT